MKNVLTDIVLAALPGSHLYLTEQHIKFLSERRSKNNVSRAKKRELESLDSQLWYGSAAQDFFGTVFTYGPLLYAFRYGRELLPLALTMTAVGITARYLIRRDRKDKFNQYLKTIPPEKE
ncbi:hypothetical protein KW805_02900 [Candidatus Pacearchaeota archaeon]|nr:hypothetical protein [Candidatus Pacearchaeota archaeon]